MNPESLIFDVDGTLWDSVDLVVRGWNLALEEAGAHLHARGHSPALWQNHGRNCFGLSAGPGAGGTAEAHELLYGLGGPGDAG